MGVGGWGVTCGPRWAGGSPGGASQCARSSAVGSPLQRLLCPYLSPCLPSKTARCPGREPWEPSATAPSTHTHTRTRTRTRCREAGPECRALSGPERPARNRPAEWTDRISRPGPCRTLLPGLPVWSPPSGSLGGWNQATSYLSLQETGLHSKKLVAHPWILTIRWPEKLGTFLFCLLKCLMTKILFSFLMWVSKDERPVCVTCTTYEISPKVV